jgi:adenylate cyclase
MDDSPDIVRAMRTGASSEQPLSGGEAERAGEISDWLLREGRFATDNRELLTGFCERVSGIGVPLDRASLHLRAFHPQYRGVSRVWRPGQPLDERFLDHGLEKTATYIESPVRVIAEERQRHDWRLDGDGAPPFEILDELRDEGYSHYVIAPLVNARAGLTNALSWATRQPGGFSPEDLRLFDEVLPLYATLVEAKSMWRFAESMLTTYVGREPARFILDGQVRRGDVRTITAALMLVDLRNFTLLSDRETPRSVIRVLNDYFDCVFPPVQAHGGEIMEIMGDGILAIFRQEFEWEAAKVCNAALVAATKSLAEIAERNRRYPPDAPVLQAGIALHYGTVSYGNIGSGDRLDFTVIGPDVNLTSRIERLCRELDRHLIMSESFVQALGRPMWELGAFDLRGFSRMQRLYELPLEEPGDG